MELRGYERAKSRVDNTKKDEDLPDHPMIELVQDIEHAIAAAKREAMRG